MSNQRNHQLPRSAAERVTACGALVCCGLFAACRPALPPKVPAPVPASVVEREGGVRVVVLTEAAIARTHLVTAAVTAVPQSGGVLVVPGTIVARPRGRAEVRAPVSGTLLATEPERNPGAHVESGQWLARLRPIVTPQRFVGIEAQASLDAAIARKDAAQANASRIAGLQKDGSVSARAVEQANADLAAAKAQLLLARAQLSRLDQRALDADVVVPIRSPISGTLTAVNAPAGQLVDTGMQLFTVVDLTQLWVQATLYTGDLVQLSPEAPARVRLLGGTTWTTASRTAQPDLGVALSPNVTVMLALDDVDTTLPLGARVEVEFVTRPRGATVSVPASATFFDGLGSPHVYVARTPLEFVRTPIDVVSERDGTVLLRSGPPVGAQVVTRGVSELIGTEEGVGH